MILIDPYGKYGVIGKKNNQQGSHWPWSKHGLYVELVHPTIIIPLIDTFRSFMILYCEYIDLYINDHPDEKTTHVTCVCCLKIFQNLHIEGFLKWWGTPLIIDL